MAITAQRIYELACHGVFTAADDDEDFKQFSPAALNACMIEAIPYENQFRALDGRPLLTVDEVPDLEEIDDTEIDMFDQRIARLAFPYGIKAFLLEDDGGRKAEAVMYRNRFIEALNELQPAVFEDIEAGEDDE